VTALKSVSTRIHGVVPAEVSVVATQTGVNNEFLAGVAANDNDDTGGALR
jgi:hypothetical protein